MQENSTVRSPTQTSSSESKDWYKCLGCFRRKVWQRRKVRSRVKSSSINAVHGFNKWEGWELFPASNQDLGLYAESVEPPIGNRLTGTTLIYGFSVVNFIWGTENSTDRVYKHEDVHYEFVRACISTQTFWFKLKSSYCIKQSSACLQNAQNIHEVQCKSAQRFGFQPDQAQNRARISHKNPNAIFFRVKHVEAYVSVSALRLNADLVWMISFLQNGQTWFIH